MELRMVNAKLTRALSLVAVALAVGACREAEQARPLDFKPHVYYGEKLPPLSEKQKRDLQERGNLQR
jgi:hypothetical protein